MSEDYNFLSLLLSSTNYMSKAAFLSHLRSKSSNPVYVGITSSKTQSFTLLCCVLKFLQNPLKPRLEFGFLKRMNKVCNFMSIKIQKFLDIKSQKTKPHFPALRNPNPFCNPKSQQLYNSRSGSGSVGLVIYPFGRLDKKKSILLDG